MLSTTDNNTPIAEFKQGMVFGEVRSQLNPNFQPLTNKLSWALICDKWFFNVCLLQSSIRVAENIKRENNVSGKCAQLEHLVPIYHVCSLPKAGWVLSRFRNRWGLLDACLSKVTVITLATTRTLGLCTRQAAASPITLSVEEQFRRYWRLRRR